MSKQKSVDLSSLTVKKLRKRCKDANLFVFGTKATLVDRLTEYYEKENKNEQSDSNDEPPKKKQKMQKSIKKKGSNDNTNANNENSKKSNEKSNVASFDSDDNNNKNEESEEDDIDIITQNKNKDKSKKQNQKKSNQECKDNDNDNEDSKQSPSSSRSNNNNNNNSSNNNNNNNDSNHVSNNEIIRLNVGGVKYLTSKSTLMNFSDESNHHMLSCMFGGRFLQSPNFNGNEHFIDRNGKYFEYILDFLRNGHNYIKNLFPKLDKETIECIKQESIYFGLQNIMFKELNNAIIHWQMEFRTANEFGYKVSETDGFTFLRDKIKITKYDEMCYSDTIPREWIINKKTIYFDINEKTIEMKENDPYSKKKKPNTNNNNNNDNSSENEEKKNDIILNYGLCKGCSLVFDGGFLSSYDKPFINCVQSTHKLSNLNCNDKSRVIYDFNKCEMRMQRIPLLSRNEKNEYNFDDINNIIYSELFDIPNDCIDRLRFGLCCKQMPKGYACLFEVNQD